MCIFADAIMKALCHLNNGMLEVFHQAFDVGDLYLTLKKVNHEGTQPQCFA